MTPFDNSRSECRFKQYSFKTNMKQFFIAVKRFVRKNICSVFTNQMWRFKIGANQG